MPCLTLTPTPRTKGEGNLNGFAGPVEVREAYFRGLEKNKPSSVRLHAGAVSPNETGTGLCGLPEP